MIYFVTLFLSKQVHVQALGFTKLLYSYAYASSEDQANQLATSWYRQQGCEVVRASCSLANRPALSSFTFPEQIVNLPEELLIAEFDRRCYPDSLRSPGRCVSAASPTAH